jgi:quercetin dioxygenase-like cupin family protein
MVLNMEDLVRATSLVQVDDARVKVTLWHFPPGSHTGWHKHVLDYVVVPTIGGRLTIAEMDGSRREVEYKVANTYARASGAEHDVLNLSGSHVEFVEIELK